MEPVTVPEIRRANLSNVVMTLKAMGITDIFNFRFLDPPDREPVIMALRQLYLIGALDSDGKPTTLGLEIARLPLDPAFGRCLLASVPLGCAEAMTTLLAILSTENI